MFNQLRSSKPFFLTIFPGSVPTTVPTTPVTSLPETTQPVTSEMIGMISMQRYVLGKYSFLLLQYLDSIKQSLGG